MNESQSAPLTLWLTDRSRYATGTGRCARLRYLTNHFGPTGYGIVRKTESLPLATGKYTHLALEQLFLHLKAHDTFPTVPIIREAIRFANVEYDRAIQARGFAGLLKSERSDYVIREQQTWLEGAVWAACRTVLPWLHANYKVLEAEQETIYILDCTCGLGSAVTDPALHDAKGCQGIGQMLKQDVIAEARDGHGLAYFETKTTGWVGENWAPQWETRPQLSIGTFGIEERLGKPIVETFIIGLYKGQRKRTEDAFGGEYYRQESPFCYGYLRPANPPLSADDWLPSYEWTDEQTGETKRASRQHKKAPIWDLPLGDWPIWLNSKAHDPSLTPVECWTAWLPKPLVEKQVFLVGPMRRQDIQVEALKRQIVGEERHWQDLLWKLYETEAAGHSWGDPAFHAELDRLVPASWDCRRFGSRHECEMLDLCFQQEGWRDPLATGKWVPRRPHHVPELAVAIGRGLLPELAEEIGEEED